MQGLPVSLLQGCCGTWQSLETGGQSVDKKTLLTTNYEGSEIIFLVLVSTLWYTSLESSELSGFSTLPKGTVQLGSSKTHNPVNVIPEYYTYDF